MSTDTKHFGTRVSLSSKRSKPRSTSSGDGWCDGNSLDIGNGRWTTEKSYIGWEWRLQSWFTLFALDRFDKGSLLSTDISSSTSVEVDVESVSRSTSVLAEETSGISLVDGLLDVRCFLVELSSNVDVGWDQ